MNLISKLTFSVFLSTTFLLAKAQLTVTPITPQDAVNNVLVGSGISVSNITSQGSPSQFGQFNGINSNLGLNGGIVLSTADLSLGPNVLANGPILGAGTPGYAPLTPPGEDSFNGAVLQFDFVPAGDTLKFDYVFASMEYTSFTCSEYNDIFRFYISGPNPLGGNYNQQNIAIVPGTNLDVTINTVNCGQPSSPFVNVCTPAGLANSQYFVQTCPATSAQNQGVAFNGFTVPLAAIAPVIPCSTYTLTLAIVDIVDGGFNSAVFLRENSLGTGAVTINPTYNYTNALNDTLIYEGCSDVTIDFLRDGNIGVADTVDLVITGTATNGVDYSTLPSQIIFAPGQTQVSVSVSAIQDALVEGPETVTLSITTINLCGQPTVSSVTFTISDVVPLSVNGGPDRTICPGVPQTFDAVTTGGVPPLTVVWTFPGGAGTDPLNFTPINGGNYVVTASDGCGLYPNATDTVIVTIGPPQFSLSAEIDSSSCFGVNNGAINLSVSGQTPPFTYLWTPGNLTTQDLSNLGPGIYNVEVTDTFGCEVNASYEVFEPANIVFNIPDQFICSEDELIINNNPLPNVNYSWSPPEFFNNPNAASPTVNGVNPGPGLDTLFLSATATSPGACGTDNFRIFIAPLPEVSLFLAGLDTTALCTGDTLDLFNSASNVGYPTVTGFLWNTGSTNDSIRVNTPGLYWLELTNQAGCKERDSLVVVPVTFPTPQIEPEFFICGNSFVTLLATGYDSTATSFLWSNNETTETISVNVPGPYTLIVGNDCSEDTVFTTVIQIPVVNVEEMPNIFTPNGDNINDVYNVPALFEYAAKFNVKIFSRWGNKVFETEDKEINWAPKNLSDGVYFMTILYSDCNNEEKKIAHSITVITK